MTRISPARRFGIAATCIVLSGVLFRPQIATALITRGDECLQQGALDAARRYYARALWFDARSTLAADRFAFSGLEVRTPASVASSIAVATSALELAPDEVNLLTDRALLYQSRRQFAAARSDFARAAQLARDARLYHFAAWASYRSGDSSAAVRYWRTALSVDPSFDPPRFALLKIGRPQ